MAQSVLTARAGGAGWLPVDVSKRGGVECGQWFPENPTAYLVSPVGPMRTPEDLLKTVVFMMGNGIPVGTAFVVEVPSGIRGLVHNYLVTAKHGVDEYHDLEFRFNVKNGTARTTPIDRSGWRFHPLHEDTCDVAVLPIALPPDADCLPIDIRLCLSPMQRITSNASTFSFGDLERLESPIELGDDVSIIGLLRGAPGRSSVIPVVRCGTVSRISPERIPWKDRDDDDTIYIDAWLVESIAASGLSGAPVFASAPGGCAPVTGHALNIAYLFGMVRGHWEYTIETGDAINIGIAAVTPSYMIAETIDRDDLKDMRRKVEEAERKSSGQGFTPIND